MSDCNTTTYSLGNTLPSSTFQLSILNSWQLPSSGTTIGISCYTLVKGSCRCVLGNAESSHKLSTELFLTLMQSRGLRNQHLSHTRENFIYSCCTSSPDCSLSTTRLPAALLLGPGVEWKGRWHDSVARSPAHPSPRRQTSSTLTRENKTLLLPFKRRFKTQGGILPSIGVFIASSTCPVGRRRHLHHLQVGSVQSLPLDWFKMVFFSLLSSSWVAKTRFDAH